MAQPRPWPELGTTPLCVGLSGFVTLSVGVPFSDFSRNHR